MHRSSSGPICRFLALTSFQSLNRPSLSSGSSSRISLLRQSFSVSRARLRPPGNVHFRSDLLLPTRRAPASLQRVLMISPLPFFTANQRNHSHRFYKMLDEICQQRCPKWVRTRRSYSRGPFYPNERTSSVRQVTSETCHNQTLATQHNEAMSSFRQAGKPGWLSHRRSFGPEPRGRVAGRRLPCVRGFKQGQLLCLAMNADRLSDRFRQSSQISISVPNSTTCLAGTPKKVAEPLALCCRNTKRVSRQTAMPTTSSLGMIVSRPT